MVRGDQDEARFSDGSDRPRSKKLYPTSKKLFPNIFSGTCFKSHQNIMVEQWMRQETFPSFTFSQSLIAPTT